MIQLNPVTGNAAHVEKDWKTGVFMIESSGRVKDPSHLPKQLAHEIAVVGRQRKRQDDVDYWQSRAERTRRQASRYRDQAIRDPFMKIAAGYDELARSARNVRDGTETI